MAHATEALRRETPADRVLEIERLFDAPRELVFRLWSAPEHIGHWWGPFGHHLSHCEMDFREGGSFRFCMMPESGRGHWINGSYRDVQPPQRLSFTYTNEADGHEMLVELDFLEEARRTRLKFRQATFLSVGERDGHQGGWTQTFDIFARYLLLYQTGGLSESALGWRQGEAKGVEADLKAAAERASRPVTMPAGRQPNARAATPTPREHSVLTVPKIAERPAQPYVALRRTVQMPFGDVVGATMPKLFQWVGDHRVEPAGPPFFKYNVIDMAREIEMEFGVPTAMLFDPDAEVVTGMLPAGRYATLTHHGHYDRLLDANAVLIGWAKERGLRFDVQVTPTGDKFAGRFEVYPNDPQEVPNPDDWETEIWIKLAP